MIRILLDCVVRRPNSVFDQFEIRWFRENTTGTVEDLDLGNPIMNLGSDQVSQYHQNKFLDQPYSPSLLGKYWCQVINTTADPDQPLMRSNVFTLLAPGDYNETTCPGTQAVNNITCADLFDLGKTTTSHQSSIFTDVALSSGITLSTPAHTSPVVTRSLAVEGITSHTAIIPTTQSLSHMPSFVTTPIQLSDAQQNPFIIVIAVMGVVIVIISVVAVTCIAIVILLIKWRQSTNSNKG